MIHSSMFDPNFIWGVSTAAYQIEGAHLHEGKSASIWDQFVQKKGKIAGGHHANTACDFHRRYRSDLSLMQSMQIKNFRFSTAWSRILPEGIGAVNEKGMDFYDRLVDECLELDIQPWVTLYHWDLPHALELKGGWTNRDVISWFLEYTEKVVRRLSDRVKNWLVLNEPMVFTGAGYFLGVHAPGRMGIKPFMQSVHHAAICQAQGSHLIHSLQGDAEVGSTFSCSHIEPLTTSERDVQAAKRMDALLNRLFLEPALGLGYPVRDLPVLNRLEKVWKSGDEALLKADFDFIGLQNYTREIVSHAFTIPYLQAKIIRADKRNVPATVMNWEVYPDSLYHMLKQIGNYPAVHKIIVTENGAAFPDHVIEGEVMDHERKEYLKAYITAMLKASQEGVPVKGYFVWSFLDNFEWAEGYYPRFGLVYVDFKTQQRIIKHSGYWYQRFLSGGTPHRLHSLLHDNPTEHQSIH